MPIPKGIGLSRSAKAFEIGDGVRRAKAAQELGLKSIDAIDNSGNLFKVSIKDLRSHSKAQ